MSGLRARWVVGVLGVVLAVSGGCGVVGGEPEFLPLEERSSVEEARESLDEMTGEMREALTEEFPEGSWEIANDPGTAPGGEEYEGMRAIAVSSALWGFDRSVASGQDRERALAVVSEVGERHGFGTLEVYADHDDSFQAIAWNASGDNYRFGSQERTTLTYRTSPRLNAEQLASIG